MLDCQGKYLSIDSLPANNQTSPFRLTRGIQWELWLNPLGFLYSMYGIFTYMDGPFVWQISRETKIPFVPWIRRIISTWPPTFCWNFVPKKLFHHKWHRSCHTPGRFHHSKRCLREVELSTTKTPKKTTASPLSGPPKHLYRKSSIFFEVGSILRSW